MAEAPAFLNAVFVLLRLFLTGNLSRRAVDRQLIAGNRFSMMACGF